MPPRPPKPRFIGSNAARVRVPIGFRAPRFQDFLDRDRVVRRLDRQSRRVLVRIGGFIRTTARRSMRPAGKKRSRVSQPGTPPRWHTKLLRGSGGSRFGVFFSYDAARRSVVVGPNLILAKRRRKDREGRRVSVSSTLPTPAVLEVGGTIRIRRGISRTSARISPRPYMKPAYDKALRAPNLRRWWRAVRF